MTTRALLSAAAIAASILLAGCGGSDSTATSTVTETVSELDDLHGVTSTTTARPLDHGGRLDAGRPDRHEADRLHLADREHRLLHRPAAASAATSAIATGSRRRRRAAASSTTGRGSSCRAGGAADFVCAGDTALGGGDVLDYGTSIGAGLLLCESEESGMTCRDTETGRGFTLSKQSYEIF